MTSSKSSAKSPSPDAKFFRLAAFTMLTAAAGLAALWAPAVSFAHWQSGRLLEEGRGTRDAEAETDFLLAVRLNPANTTAQVELARAQIAAGRPNEALATLKKAGQGSEPRRLAIQTLIELGRYNAAADAATALALSSHPAEADLRLATLALLLAGRTSDAQALADGAPEATAAGIHRAAASPLALADQLSATGLNKSAAALLQHQPASYERNLLLARILYAHHSQDGLNQITELLTTAVATNPAAIPARELLAKVYQDRSNLPAAEQQISLIKHLQSGTP